MPTKYYPLTRVITNLYTAGADFIIPGGGRYVGRYYRTYDGKAFAGINPIVGSNIQLIPSELDKDHTLIRDVNQSTQTYSNVQDKQQDPGAFFETLTELKPYYPVPLDSDYARGYFTRYFAKTVSGPGYVLEISQTDWAQLQDGLATSDILGYESTSMLWQLTGPLRDTRVSQYQIKGGVHDTNKRVTEAKAVSFVGLVAFIGENYTKFAKITPSVAATGSM